MISILSARKIIIINLQCQHNFDKNYFQNLMEKLQDKEDLKCGEKSSVKFRDKKVRA